MSPNRNLKRLLHVNQDFGDSWMIPILQAIRVSVEAGRLPGFPEELRDLSLYIGTRFDMIRRLENRLDRETSCLRLACNGYPEAAVFTAEKEGYALRVDRDLVYDFLIDIDAILFEVAAAIDLLKCLLGVVHVNIGLPVPKKLGKELERILKDAGEDVTWFGRLDKYRNLFSHNAAPFLALDVTANPWDFCIMKKNVKYLSDEDDHFKLSEVAAAMQGFYSSRDAFQTYIVGLCMATGEALAPNPAAPEGD